MRPTITEQLVGAIRLLRLVEQDAKAGAEAMELVVNARRLVERVASSHQAALPFIEQDNARLARLLSLDPPDCSGLVEAVAANEELRARLSLHIAAMPAGQHRDEIGAYLLERIANDPT